MNRVNSTFYCKYENTDYNLLCKINTYEDMFALPIFSFTL